MWKTAFTHPVITIDDHDDDDDVDNEQVEIESDCRLIDRSIPEGETQWAHEEKELEKAFVRK